MILFVLKFIFVFTSPPVKELLHRKPELAIDIVITKHNGEKSPLTKSYLKSLKSLAKSFINNRSTNRT